jgi:hypothetical protein
LGGILPQKQPLALIALAATFHQSERSHQGSAGMHGFVDNRPAPSLLVTFLGTAPQERREQRSWPRSGEGQDARSHAKK